jgi:hypothetical protein
MRLRNEGWLFVLVFLYERVDYGLLSLVKSLLILVSLAYYGVAVKNTCVIEKECVAIRPHWLDR